MLKYEINHYFIIDDKSINFFVLNIHISNEIG